jgi:hypothetical protein
MRKRDVVPHVNTNTRLDAPHMCTSSDVPRVCTRSDAVHVYKQVGSGAYRDSVSQLRQRIAQLKEQMAAIQGAD